MWVRSYIFNSIIHCGDDESRKGEERKASYVCAHRNMGNKERIVLWCGLQTGPRKTVDNVPRIPTGMRSHIGPQRDKGPGDRTTRLESQLLLQMHDVEQDKQLPQGPLVEWS